MAVLVSISYSVGGGGAKLSSASLSGDRGRSMQTPPWDGILMVGLRGVFRRSGWPTDRDLMPMKDALDGASGFITELVLRKLWRWSTYLVRDSWSPVSIE